MNGLSILNQQMAPTAESCHRESTLNRFKRVKIELEKRLEKVDEAIKLFEENPTLNRAIDLLAQI